MWLLSVAVAGLLASPIVLESGPSRVTLVELFTSEGCSSCPPAEERFAKLRRDPGLWTDIVPVSFHVDYWDGLGWPDRFASPEFTRRQRAYAARWNSGSVYTPAFVFNGREGSRSDAAQDGTDAGRLRVEVTGSGQVDVTYYPSKPPTGGLRVELAPLADAVVSDVARGENAGRRLKHEFVALGLVGAPLTPAGEGWTARVELPGNSVAPIFGLAAWIHEEDDPSPLQAVGGWLRRDGRL